MSEGTLTRAEHAHLLRLLQWKETRGAGQWCDTKFAIDRPLSDHEAGLVILSLEAKGLVRITNQLVCGPLRIPADVWGVIITDKGEVLARLLGPDF